MTGHLLARRVMTLVLILVLLTMASTMFLATTLGAPDVCAASAFWPDHPACPLDLPDALPGT